MSQQNLNWTLQANSAAAVVAYKGYNVRISCKQPGKETLITARRRFVYCWKRADKATSWENLGLFMTDDDGRVFDLETFMNDKNISNANLKVNKYDPEQGKFVDRTWQFFGGTEETLCFQKHCSDAMLGKKSAKDIEISKKFGEEVSFQLVDPDAGPIYSNPFFIEDKYLMVVEAGFEYFLMFCPPDIVLKGASSQNSTGSSSLTMRPVNSTTKPELKFIKEPLRCWLDNSYITGEGETLADIATKTDSTASAIKKLEQNSGKLPVDGKPFPKGVVIAIPHSLKSSFGFGRPLNLKGFVNTVEPDKLDYNRINQMPLSTPVLDLPLPVTLEEYLSNLASTTCLLDITWAKIIASTKVFMETSQKLRHIGDLIDLMLRFPGYKSRQAWRQSARYFKKMSIRGEDLSKIHDIYTDSEKLSDDISTAAFTMQNPIVKKESKALFSLSDQIFSFFSESDFIEALAQWRLFSYYAKDQNAFPYLWDKQQVPVLYQIIENTITLMMNCTVKKNGSDPKCPTIAQTFYLKTLFSFQAQLESIFNSLDSQYGFSDELFKRFKEMHILDQVPGQPNPDKQNAPVFNLKTDSVVTVVFKDILTDKILAKSSKHLTNILRVATQFRVSALIANCEKKQRHWALYHFKIAFASLFITERSPEKLKKKFNDAVASFENNQSRLSIQRERLGKIVEHQDKAIKTSVEDSKYLEAAIGSVYYFWSIYEFTQTLTPGKVPEWKEWVKMVSLVRSGWAIAAGLGMEEVLRQMRTIKVMETMLLRNMGKDCRRHVRGGMALYKSVDELVDKVSAGIDTIMLPVDIYKKCVDAYADWLGGDRTKAILRCIQTGIGLASVAGGPWGKAAGALAELGIEATIMIREACRLGMQNSIKSLTDSIVHGNLFSDSGSIVDTIAMRKRHQELYSDATFILATNTTILNIVPSAVSYEVDKGLVERIRALAKLCGSIKYVNLDVIKAGSVLKAKGYSDDDIAYITMEIGPEGKRFSLSEYEKKYIKGFAETGTFNADDSVPVLAKNSYRDPLDDFYYLAPGKTLSDEVTFVDPPTPDEYFMEHYKIWV